MSTHGPAVSQPTAVPTVFVFLPAQRRIVEGVAGTGLN